VACRSEIVKGSPSTLVWWCEGEIVVVDPGHGRKRAKQLLRKLREPGGRIVFLVTHYHSDHLNALGQGLLDSLGSKAVVAAPRLDAPGIRDPLVRVAMTFGYPLPAGSPLLSFEPLPSRVDVELDPPVGLGGLEVVPLPGHTPGQVGVVTSDGVLYAADAIFGSRVLERYAVPYHLDPCRALESLDTLERYAREGYTVQPSHGPSARGEEALSMVEANRSAIKGLLERVENCLETPRTLDSLARCAVPGEPPGAPGLALLVQTAVRGALACLHARGRVSARPVGPGLVEWVLQG